MITIKSSPPTLSINGREIDLYSEESFEYISKLWLKIGWANKYCYKYTWLGRPILQLPEDMLKIQEIIFSIKPTCIIETGVANGGSLIYYSSLLKILGIDGQVIGVEINIKDNNREAIKNHPMSSTISLIEGNSTDQLVIDKVKALRNEEDITLVILDSCHTKEHVLNELRHYSQFVSIGSYILATDGIIKELADIEESPALLKLRPEGIEKDYSWNNPQEAVETFLEENKDFRLENISPLFNESSLTSDVTYWPNAYLRRIK